MNQHCPIGFTMYLRCGYCAIGEEGEENKLNFVGYIALLYRPVLANLGSSLSLGHRPIRGP